MDYQYSPIFLFFFASVEETVTCQASYRFQGVKRQDGGSEARRPLPLFAQRKKLNK